MSTEAFCVRGRPSSKEGVHILAPKGAISFASAPVFREAVDAAPAPRLIIDLTEVPSIDSVAVGVLVRAFVSCHKAGRRLALAGLAPRVRNVLQLTGIDPLFEIYPTVEDAERAFA
jgi:anti-anti-sigma factor